jgi:signal transduction histidine kinase
MEALEQERRHLARELHDQIGQALTAIQLHLQAALGLGGPPALVEQLRASLQLLDDLVQKTRDLSLHLRPPMLDDLGLPSALRWFTESQARQAKLHAEFWASPLPHRLDPAIETACFRIAQEAITNVIRHARAQEFAVSMQCEDDTLHLTIHDDGVGFEAAATARGDSPAIPLGLLGMQERALLAGGRFECRSSPSQGTEIHAWFPLRWRNAAPTTSTPALP